LCSHITIHGLFKIVGYAYRRALHILKISPIGDIGEADLLSADCLRIIQYRKELLATRMASGRQISRTDRELRIISQNNDAVEFLQQIKISGNLRTAVCVDTNCNDSGAGAPYDT
jgi:hypothetical protein